MPENVPLTPQDHSEKDRHSVENQKPRKQEVNPATTELQIINRTMQNLEKSDQAVFIKELMVMYLAERQLHDEVQRTAFMDKVRTQNVTIEQIVEGMVEAAVQNDPALLRRFQNREVTVAQIAEGVIDQMFAIALAHANSPKFPEGQRKERIAQLQAAIAALSNAAASARSER